MDITSWLQQLCSAATTMQINRCHRYRGRPTWNFSRREINDHLLYYVIDGTICFELGDGANTTKQYLVHSGQAAWIGPNVYQHGYNALSSEIRFFVLRVHFSRDNCVFTAPQSCTIADVPPSLLDSLDEIARNVRLPGELAELRCKLRIADCFAQLSELHHSKTVVTSAGLSMAQRHELHNWLLQHIKHDPQPSDLAKVLNLSPTTFRRLFKSTFGTNPRSWISAARLQHVADLLLASDDPIHEVAEACGYESVPSLTRLFSRQFGCSPRNYRQHADRSAQAIIAFDPSKGHLRRSELETIN